MLVSINSNNCLTVDATNHPESVFEAPTGSPPSSAGMPSGSSQRSEDRPARQLAEEATSRTVIDRSQVEHSNQRTFGSRRTDNLQDHSPAEPSGVTSVSDDTTVVEEDAATLIYHRSDKGRCQQIQSRATTDHTLPLQVSIQLLDGRVESLEKRLPSIEEAIKLLSNLLASQRNPTSTDPFQGSPSTASNSLLQSLTHDPMALDLTWHWSALAKDSDTLQSPAFDQTLPSTEDMMFQNETDRVTNQGMPFLDSMPFLDLDTTTVA